MELGLRTGHEMKPSHKRIERARAEIDRELPGSISYSAAQPSSTYPYGDRGAAARTKAALLLIVAAAAQILQHTR